MNLDIASLPDYIFFDDIAKNHPESKLSSDDNQEAEANKSDKEIQRLLGNLTIVFSVGIDLLSSH